MRFNVAFGKTNVFSLDIVPVTHRDWYNHLLDNKRQPVQSEIDGSRFDPDGASFIGTLEKARKMCEGATVVFA